MPQHVSGNVCGIATATLISPEECDEIIKVANDLGFAAATVLGNSSSPDQVKTEMRSTSLCEISKAYDHNEILNHMVRRLIHVANDLNRDGWKFDIGNKLELICLKYDPGDHYQAYHMDLGTDSASTRKLTFTLQLSSETDYTGGELCIGGSDQSHDVASKKKGSIIMFPSFMNHCVKPMSGGVRYSLVGWIHGPHFR